MVVNSQIEHVSAVYRVHGEISCRRQSSAMTRSWVWGWRRAYACKGCRWGRSCWGQRINPLVPGEISWCARKAEIAWVKASGSNTTLTAEGRGCLRIKSGAIRLPTCRSRMHGVIKTVTVGFRCGRRRGSGDPHARAFSGGAGGGRRTKIQPEAKAMACGSSPGQGWRGQT